MKPTHLLLVLATAAFVGCAGADKVIKKLDSATAAINTAVQTTDKVVAAASTTANTAVAAVDKMGVDVEKVSQETQRMAARAAVITHYNGYTVVKGDSLWRISRKKYATGFLWPLLCEQNGLQDCNRTKTGATLRYASPELLATYADDELSKYRKLAYGAK